MRCAYLNSICQICPNSESSGHARWQLVADFDRVIDEVETPSDSLNDQLGCKLTQTDHIFSYVAENSSKQNYDETQHFSSTRKTTSKGWGFMYEYSLA